MNLGFQKLSVYQDKTSGSKGSRFVIDPLEVGYGTTLGNSLRRILIRSMPGVGVIGFRSAGVTHPFMTIPGTATDTTELTGNLKKLRFKMDDGSDDGVKVVLFRGTESKVYKADSLILPEGVTLMNPELELINVLGKDDVDIEIFIKKSRGFVSANNHTGLEEEEGVIQVDGKFTPIKSVSYNVVPYRVGNVVKSEQLIINVETDGSIQPLEAIATASKIARSHYSFFDDIKDLAEKTIVHQEKKAEQNFVLNQSLNEMDLSFRSSNWLNAQGITTVGELVNLTEREIRSYKNIGETSVKEIKEKLEQMGLSLSQE